MQRELSDDAPWKRIQQNTFTRWANEHLKLLNRHVDDLQTELGDGLNLIGLIEVLSQKKIPRYNKKPNFRSQKLENVSVVLDFLENTERIRLVNIGKCPSATGDNVHTRRASDERKRQCASRVDCISVFRGGFTSMESFYVVNRLYQYWPIRHPVHCHGLKKEKKRFVFHRRNPMR